MVEAKPAIPSFATSMPKRNRKELIKERHYDFPLSRFAIKSKELENEIAV